jgi:hypothetical protein
MVESAKQQSINTVYPMSAVRAEEIPALIKKAAKSTSAPELIKSKLQTLLERYSHVFEMSLKTCGKLQVPPHTIELTADKVITQRAYRTSPKEQQEIDHLVQEMITQGVIRRGQSPYASPVLMVSKKDGSTRFCIDYRRLNAITKKDKYPMPEVQECLDSGDHERVFPW